MMMKYVVYIFAILCVFSCKSKVIGLYKHEICGNSPDCFLYDFCKDGHFTYWYSQDVLGSATLTGLWTRNGDTVFLKPDKYIFETKTKIEYTDRIDKDSIRIRIGLIPKYFKNRNDTIWLKWIVLLNNNTNGFETDDKGILKANIDTIKRIIVRDFMTKYNTKPLIQIHDSIFDLTIYKKDIDIFISCNEIEPTIIGVNEKMLIKGNKLYSLNDSAKVTRPDKYIRIKRKCGRIVVK